jgi:hypothetical protein
MLGNSSGDNKAPSNLLARAPDRVRTAARRGRSWGDCEATARPEDQLAMSHSTRAKHRSGKNYSSCQFHSVSGSQAGCGGHSTPTAASLQSLEMVLWLTLIDRPMSLRTSPASLLDFASAI